MGNSIIINLRKPLIPTEVSKTKTMNNVNNVMTYCIRTDRSHAATSKYKPGVLEAVLL